MLYKFKTFRTSYYFPIIGKENQFLYKLYHAFGSRLSKIYWWLFQNLSIVRIVNKVDNPDLYFPYSKIMDLCPKDSLVSFNLGTPGVEQKISMLGIEKNGNRFFAKYSAKSKAIQLSKNEIKILIALNKTGLTPTLYDYTDKEDAVFFRTSFVDGIPLSDISISEKIVDLALMLTNFHLESVSDKDSLKYCLSHGDFTPWNIMIVDGKYKLIDWELAGERPVGYDLFLYISQFSGKKGLLQTYKDAKNYIDYYFDSLGINNWSPYLKAFAEIKTSNELEKGELEKAFFFKQILDFKL